MANIKKISVQGTTHDIFDDAISIAASTNSAKSRELKLHGTTVALQEAVGIDINAGTAGTGVFLNKLGSFTAPPSIEGSVTREYIETKIYANASTNTNKMYIGGGTAGGVWEAKPTMTASFSTTTGDASGDWVVNGSTFGLTVQENSANAARKIIVAVSGQSHDYEIPKVTASNTGNARNVTVNGTSVHVPNATATAKSVTVDGTTFNGSISGRTVNLGGDSLTVPSASISGRTVNVDTNSVAVPDATIVSNVVKIDGQTFTGSIGTAGDTGTAVNIQGSATTVPKVTTTSIRQGTAAYDAKAVIGISASGSTSTFMNAKGEFKNVASVSGDTLIIP